MSQAFWVEDWKTAVKGSFFPTNKRPTALKSPGIGFWTAVNVNLSSLKLHGSESKKRTTHQKGSLIYGHGNISPDWEWNSIFNWCFDFSRFKLVAQGMQFTSWSGIFKLCVLQSSSKVGPSCFRWGIEPLVFNLILPQALKNGAQSYHISTTQKSKNQSIASTRLFVGEQGELQAQVVGRLVQLICGLVTPTVSVEISGEQFVYVFFSSKWQDDKVDV